MQSLYDSDFYSWTQKQAQLLREQQWHQLDLNNLIEEIESLGRQERQQIRNILSILITHLLKWEYQPTKRRRSWLSSIRIQRIDLSQLLEDSPSLKSYLPEIFSETYENGRDLAAAETNLPFKSFPKNCPYLIDEVLSDRFYPGEPSIELEEN